MYQRTVREDGTSLNWIKIREITNTSDRKFVVNLEKGKEYEFVVSATNSFGEGGKEERKIRKIKVLGGRCFLAQVSFLTLFTLSSISLFSEISTIKVDIMCDIGLHPMVV